MWDSRADDEHFKRKVWPKRQWVIGKQNVIYPRLVEPEKILPPPSHIKLGLMNFVRALNNEGQAFKALQEVFPKLSKEKVKAGIFDGPQIRELFKSDHFELLLNEVELAAWTYFKNVVNGFLGNNRAANFKDLVDTLMDTYKAMGGSISLYGHLG